MYGAGFNIFHGIVTLTPCRGKKPLRIGIEGRKTLSYVLAASASTRF